ATTLTTVLPWDDAADAHRRIETEHTLGKIVLRVKS
ncbi:MAG: zinc-binding dehydrogenase, partial [Caldilineaceae bacterium]|nr:zinc-binding dehydrogenase [Caldilineaceae bacterium]